MAKLTTLMYANEVRNEIINSSGESVQNIKMPLLSLKPAFIPGQLSFAVIFGITDFDFSKEHTFQYKLTDPDNNITIDTGEVRLPPNPNTKEYSKLDGFVGTFDLRNVIFLKEGQYKYQVFFDNIIINEDYIRVKGAGINGRSSKS